MTGEYEAYFVDIVGSGEAVDIMPKVRDAIARCRYRHDLTPLEIAQLVEQQTHGKYIPVDLQDRVQGRNLDALTGPVISWVRSEFRIAQLQDPDVHALMPFLRLSYFRDTPPCRASAHLRDRWLKVEELVRLPVDGCDKQVCHCSYHRCSPAQAARDFAEYGNRS